MTSDTIGPQRVSIRRVADRDTRLGRQLHRLAPLLDRALGVSEIHRFCQTNNLYGRPADEFAAAGLKALGTKILGHDDMAEAIPRSGPVIVVANHPHGGIEGLAMIDLIVKHRPDLKIMANVALQVFAELHPFFIFVNPLRSNDQQSRQGLRRSLQHLRDNGVLVVFPAGRTSFFQEELGCIADAQWSRSVALLAEKSGATVLPAFFTGKNSPTFYRLGQVWFRFRLLMLARELMKMRGREIKVRVGRCLEPSKLAAFDQLDQTEVFRIESAMLRETAPAQETGATSAPQPLAQSPAPIDIEQEILRLPEHQLVRGPRGLIAGFASASIASLLLEHTTIERERAFRGLEEGSGNPRDTDRFDPLFDHIFCWDTKLHALVGCYRVAPRDRLGESYLDQMFHFDPAFFASRAPALELGRSFIAPEYQRSRHALDLLWRGIGAYLRANPAYGTLYGTVSLSRLYCPKSINMMTSVFMQPTGLVTPRIPFPDTLPPEWNYKLKTSGVTIAQLNDWLKMREPDEKGVPVLLRHYAGLNAEFHALGVDPNFAQTPGLLLTVDLSKLPASKRRRYVDPPT